jgi:outer membrane protein assembly factor BamB
VTAASNPLLRIFVAAFLASAVPGLSAAESTSAPPASEPVAAVRPVLVGDAFVDPRTGEVLGRIERGSERGRSKPVGGKPGQFHHYGSARRLLTGWAPAINLLVDANTRTATTEGVLVEDHNQVSRLGADGSTTWQFKVGSVRPPASAQIGGLVMVAADHGLIGVDARTGVTVWKKSQNEPFHRLSVAGDFVVATGGESDSIVAYRADGTEAWRAELPTGSDPDRPIDAGTALVVSERRWAGDKPWSRIYARDGRLRCALDHEGIARASEISGSEDLLIAGSRGIARITPDCKDVWRAADRPTSRHDSVGITAIDGRDFLVYSYVSGADSGADLIRIDSSTGKIVWEASASELGVGHSKYSHSVYLEPRGDELVVVSQAAGGSFVELRKMADGSLIRRTRLELAGF